MATGTNITGRRSPDDVRPGYHPILNDSAPRNAAQFADRRREITYTSRPVQRLPAISIIEGSAR